MHNIRLSHLLFTGLSSVFFKIKTTNNQGMLVPKIKRFHHFLLLYCHFMFRATFMNHECTLTTKDYGTLFWPLFFLHIFLLISNILLALHYQRYTSACACYFSRAWWHELLKQKLIVSNEWDQLYSKWEFSLRDNIQLEPENIKEIPGKLK